MSKSRLANHRIAPQPRRCRRGFIIFLAALVCGLVIGIPNRLASATGLVTTSIDVQDQTDQSPTSNRLDDETPLDSIQFGLRTPSQSIDVAEPFEVVIEVLSDVGLEVRFPPLPQESNLLEANLPTLMNGVSILDHQDQFDIPTDNPQRRLSTRRLTLESLVSGSIILPPFQISVSDRDRSLNLRTQPVEIVISSQLDPQSESPPEYRGLADTVDALEPAQPAGRNWSWIGWIAAGVLGLPLLMFGIRKLRRSHHRPLVPQAIERLEALQEEIEAGSLKNSAQDTFATIESTLKTTIELTSDLDATKLTNEQLREMFAERWHETDPLVKLWGTLTDQSESIRFGQADAGPDAQLQAVQLAQQWLRLYQSQLVDDRLDRANRSDTGNVMSDHGGTVA